MAFLLMGRGKNMYMYMYVYMYTPRQGKLIVIRDEAVSELPMPVYAKLLLKPISLSGMSDSNYDGPGVTRPIRSRKGSGTRAWLVVGVTGQTEVVEAGRQVIMRRTGLAARDLRILDPLLSYPSTIVGRERAMVINLEKIKAIITAQEVLLLNSKDPSVTPFVQQLKRRILRHHRATQPQPWEGNCVNSNWTEVHDSQETQSRTISPRNTSMGYMKFKDQDGEDKAEKKQDGMKILPFEFVALETCLEFTCSELENEASILEQEAHLALDKLTSEISTPKLERVRHIKSRLVAIIGRFQKVRDELEHLLDDDEDMAEMYLTDKLVQQQLENSSTSSMNDEDGMENQVLQPDINDRIPPEISLEHGKGFAINEDHQNAADKSKDQVFGESNGDGSGSVSHGTQANTTFSTVTKKFDVGELEMLLGAYFVQIGGTLNKLSTLREYVDDTVDYINIMLDDKENRLRQMGVKLATSILVVNAFVAVTGIFAINVHNDLYDSSQTQFLETIGGCTSACIVLYMVAIAWYKRKRLVE